MSTDDRPKFPVELPYYEVTVRLPLDRYSEAWFDQVADAAGDHAAVSGSIYYASPRSRTSPRASTS